MGLNHIHKHIGVNGWCNCNEWFNDKPSLTTKGKLDVIIWHLKTTYWEIWNWFDKRRQSK